VRTARLPTGEGAPDGDDEDPQVGQQPHYPDHAREARQPQEGGVGGEAGHERRADDHEVAHVPAAREEAPGVRSDREEADCELDHEHDQKGAVERVEHAAVGALERHVGACPEDGGVGEDHEHDAAVEGGVLGEPAAGHGDGGAGPGGRGWAHGPQS
jgi:hypothetical protein